MLRFDQFQSTLARERTTAPHPRRGRAHRCFNPRSRASERRARQLRTLDRRFQSTLARERTTALVASTLAVTFQSTLARERTTYLLPMLPNFVFQSTLARERT